MHTLLRGKEREEGGLGGEGRRDNIDQSTKGAVQLHVMMHLVVVRDVYGDVPQLPPHEVQQTVPLPLPLHQQCMVPQLGEHLHQGCLPHTCLTLNDHWHTTLVPGGKGGGGVGVRGIVREGRGEERREEERGRGGMSREEKLRNLAMNS